MIHSTAAESPGIHTFPQKSIHPVQFPLDDVTILQNPSKCPCDWFNWKALKSQRSAFKLAQIICGIVILALTHVRNRNRPYVFEAFPEIPFIFVTGNAMVATMLLLGDSLLTARPLQRAFTPVLLFQVELWFTGLAAVVHHILTYYVLVMTYQYYGVDINRVASGFGFACAGLYLVDWWNNFIKRHVIIRELYQEVKAENN